MTEQQLNTLKDLLASSKRVENSAELDATILSASLANCPAPKQAQSSYYRSFPIGFITTVALSITICVGVLLAMSQIITVDKNKDAYVLSPASSQMILDVSATNSTQSRELEVANNGALDGIRAIIKPGLPSEFGGRTTQDQILAGLELPSAQTLLEGKEFSFADERSLAENSLRGALTDINQMLRSGALNEARDRYDRLRRSCSVCELPISLEALALTNDNSTSRI